MTPRIGRAAPAGRWPAHAAADTVTLAWDDRYRRRRRLVTDGGETLLLDLERARALADGDGLAVEDGRWIAVAAAPEPVAEARCADARALARLAWHLGNRHIPVQLVDNAVRFRHDPVIADMAAGLGAEVARREAPFHPEHGAYSHRHRDPDAPAAGARGA